MKTLNEFFEEEEKYEIDRSLSYSRVTDFAKNGPEALIKRSQAQSIAMSIGHVTDDFLNENIKVLDKYFVFDGSKPSATLGKLTNIVIDNFRKIPTLEEVTEIVKANNYWGNIKNEELLLAKYDIPEFWDYITVMIEGKDKEIITSDIYLKAQELSTVIKTHKNTKDKFSDDYQRIYQYFFKIKIKNVWFRGAIDYIAINHEKKTVQIIDFKTGKDSALNFMDNFLYLRYFIQEAVYMKAFKHICKTFKLKGYTLLPFEFIYIGKNEKIPLCYTVGEKWHKAALNGFTTVSGYKYRGLYELIDDIVWHYNTRVFDMPRHLYESTGSIELDDTLINLN